MRRLKLPRIHRTVPYTTGDAQTWTYAYTWEDWEACNMIVCSNVLCDAEAIRFAVIRYFIKHPENLKEHPHFVECSEAEIRSRMKQLLSMVHLALFGITYLKLHVLWLHMLQSVNEKGRV